MNVIDIDDVVHEIAFEPTRVAVQLDGYVEEQPGYTVCSKPFGWAKTPGEPFVVLTTGVYNRQTETVCHAMRSLPEPARVTCIECLSGS